MRCEAAFGSPLEWQRLDTYRAAVIKSVVECGGHRSLEARWPEIQSQMVEKMSKLESALKRALESLNL